ncbi:abortive infection family protein [Mucisphaera calidilacus]|uniref:Abortive infection protein-like C-terminal domain-containing protein n=1 Tax=Mucisphaera calidilacus TaxID=2527982 RepID=A0A518BXD9_9BACT|nr:abortive infection family protein [Mucisphaera calidilacus]QDU71641.1 hypothetical protein Pan265_14930 [Mucisphaera calidilacus]
MNSKEAHESRTITDLTRRNIIDDIRVSKIDWSGRLNEDDFLSRLYPLDDMPSTDQRFNSALYDIRTHRITFEDWDEDWVFDDPRFELRWGDDSKLLAFLCEMVNPMVRNDKNEVAELVEKFNDHLRPDGWQLIPATEISGRPVFAPRRLTNITPAGLSAASEAAELLDSEYIQVQITRMQTSIESDPELAIGSAKDFLETICKTVNSKCGSSPKADGFPALVRCALDQVSFDLEGVENPKRAEESIRRLVGNLSGVGKAVSEVRNTVGSGHGKHAGALNPSSIYARLVVGSAITLGVFLFESILRGEDPAMITDG